MTTPSALVRRERRDRESNLDAEIVVSRYDITERPSSRSLARHQAGDHRQSTGRAAWVDRDGTPYPHPLFPDEPEREVQSDVSAQNTLGAPEGRGLVYQGIGGDDAPPARLETQVES